MNHFPDSLNLESVFGSVLKSRNKSLSVPPPIPAPIRVGRVEKILFSLRVEHNNIVGFSHLIVPSAVNVLSADVIESLLAPVENNVQSAALTSLARSGYVDIPLAVHGRAYLAVRRLVELEKVRRNGLGGGVHNAVHVRESEVRALVIAIANVGSASERARVSEVISDHGVLTRHIVLSKDLSAELFVEVFSLLRNLLHDDRVLRARVDVNLRVLDVREGVDLTISLKSLSLCEQR